MRPSMILAIARAETRSIRRLIRYWIFGVLSAFLTILIYLYYSGIHGFASRFSATVGAVGPRYLMQAMGIYVLGIFLLGLIFLAFDVRARDERERMAEVLDSRPLSNVELLVGRTLGLVAMAWAPVLFVAVVLQSIGTLALILDWWLGEPLEPASLIGFVFFDSLSAFVFWCCLIVLLAVVVRNRLVVAVAALALVGVQIWGMTRLPLYLMPLFSVVSAFGSTSSDLVPQIITLDSAIQRSMLLLMSAGFLALAAAWHPRPDSGSKSRRLAIGVGFLAAAAVGIGLQTVRLTGNMSERARHLEVHTARSEEPSPDVERLSGSVAVDPGRRLSLDLEMDVAAPAEAGLDVLTFTLNPGLEVTGVELGDAAATWTQDAGLVDVALDRPLAAGDSTTLTFRAAGRPDTTWGYLDAEIDLLNTTMTNAQVALLGFDPAIFTGRYVALMPGNGWLPTAGTSVPAGDPRTNPPDFYEIDLEVSVPDDWIVAGPGRRQTVGGGDSGRFRFAPPAPVTEVGLVASRFERHAMEVRGVELELLLHPKHRRNVELFAESVDEIRERADEMLADAERLGLPYPYGGLSLVESPTRLRGYGGGWRMETTQAMPGLLLLRENSFPTSRFEFPFRDRESFEEREGGIARAKLEAAEAFFENDFSGGNIFLGASRSFLLFQTGPTGDGALGLSFVIDELVSRLLTDRRGYFSAFLFDQSMGFVVGETITQMASGRSDSVIDALVTSASDRPSVWDLALGSALVDLDPHADPQVALNVLALKGHAIADSILDGLGRERTAAFLARLLEDHRGGHFDADDFFAAAREVGVDLEELLGDWLEDAALPGFVTSRVETRRLADSTDGKPRYQATLHVLNGEPVPGLLRLRYQLEDTESDSDFQTTEPVRVAGREAVEVGIVSSAPLTQLWLDPYLSLNRQSVQIEVPTVDEQEQIREEPLLGTRPSEWRPEETGGIVIDDLDPGFSVESDTKDGGLRLGGGISSFFTGQIDMDQGLPEFNSIGGPPTEWSRRESSSSWGTYRHTIAVVRSGSGDRRAVFAADLPHAGRWRLEYHLPVRNQSSRSTSGPGVTVNASVGLGGTQGEYDLTLVAGGEERDLEFDGRAAESGWNTLGDFQLDAGEAKLVVSNESTGRLVLADAVRFRPLSEPR